MRAEPDAHGLAARGEGGGVPVRIALDAMGGDHAPEVPLEAALEATRLRGGSLQVLLVGEPQAVDRVRRGRDLGPWVELVPAEAGPPEGGHPAVAMRRQPRNSIRECARLAASGRAQAAVSMGHTGACLVAATWEMGLLPGVERPTAPVTFAFAPDMLFLDAGPNPDPTPAEMVVFARLGAAYWEAVFGGGPARVALLSNGPEEGKGNRLAQAAHQELRRSGLAFVGNVEGLDLVRRPADVVVTDGFTGNAVLKALEGLGGYLSERLGPLLADLGLSPDHPAVREVARLADSTQTGVPVVFLGVDGIFVPGHGRSGAHALARTLIRTEELVRAGLMEGLRRAMARAH